VWDIASIAATAAGNVTITYGDFNEMNKTLITTTNTTRKTP
jgi:hypothetical protein